MAGFSSSLFSRSLPLPLPLPLHLHLRLHLSRSPAALLSIASSSRPKMQRWGGRMFKFLSTMGSSSSSSSAASSSSGQPGLKVQRTEQEWRTLLTPEQFRILRQKGTEWAGTGKYDKFSEDGIYECAGCGTPLYKSMTKFNSGCGWPAFYEGLPGAINQTVDADGHRIEITCSACGGHLGHVFKGERLPTPTDERHCVNSISLKFAPANVNEKN